MTDFICGYGSTFTNKGTERRYASGKFENIVQLAASEDNAPPCHHDKDHLWAVFTDSDHPEARSAHWHRLNPGTRHTTLWIDIDEGDPTWEQVLAIATAMANGHEFLVYTSRSHGETRPDGSIKRKYRVLFPHVTPLPMHAYSHFAKVLNDAVSRWGVIPDRVTEKSVQLCYLPNRGPEYLWYHQPGPRIDLGGEHFHWLWFAAQAAFQQAEDQRVEFIRKQETSRSPVAAFCRRHSVQQMLEQAGFESYDGINWHHPSQSTRSYGTKADDDGRGWVTASGSVKEMMGRSNGDAFDVYSTLICRGDMTTAEAYARQCLADEDDKRMGASSVEHGRQLWQNVDWVGGTPHSQRAIEEEAERRKEEAEQSKRLQKEAEAAEAERWGGPWVEQVPLPITPSPMEWLAWHAPGIVGEIVRTRAPAGGKLSLVPHLVGALAGVTYLGQGKFVSRRLQHITPCSLMIFQVGDTGSGKSDGTGTFYDVVGMVDPVKIKASRVASFASGASLKDYLMHKTADVFMVQDEGGAARAAGKGDRNFESLIAVITEAFTGFTRGLEITHTKSDEKEARFIAHPTVSAIMSSTPKKLFGSISTADGESGWLGRNLFVSLRHTRTNLQARPIQYSEELKQRLNRINDVIPPLPHTDHPDIWNGNAQSYHMIHTTPEATQLLDEFTILCDDRSAEEKRHDIERAVYSRAAEAVVRLATVVALGKYGSGLHKIDAECVSWSILLVEQSIALVTSQLDAIEDVDSTPASAVRTAVVHRFVRAKEDKSYFNRMRCRIEKGSILFPADGLRRDLKKCCKVSTKVVQDELQGMIEDETLASVEALGATRLKRYYQYIGD